MSMLKTALNTLLLSKVMAAMNKGTYDITHAGEIATPSTGYDIPRADFSALLKPEVIEDKEDTSASMQELANEELPVTPYIDSIADGSIDIVDKDKISDATLKRRYKEATGEDADGLSYEEKLAVLEPEKLASAQEEVAEFKAAITNPAMDVEEELEEAEAAVTEATTSDGSTTTIDIVGKKEEPKPKVTLPNFSSDEVNKLLARNMRGNLVWRLASGIVGAVGNAGAIGAGMHDTSADRIAGIIRSIGIEDDREAKLRAARAGLTHINNQEQLALEELKQDKDSFPTIAAYSDAVYKTKTTARDFRRQIYQALVGQGVSNEA